MLYPPVYKKEIGVPFDLGKIREQSFYKLVMKTRKNSVFLFFINTVTGCSIQGYYTYASKESVDDILEKAYGMRNLFINETKGSRRDITIYKDDRHRERNVFVYISLDDINGEFYLHQTYLNEPSFLNQPVLPIKKL